MKNELQYFVERVTEAMLSIGVIMVLIAIPLAPVGATESHSLLLVPVNKIHPTQFAVGLRDVAEKVEELKARETRGSEVFDAYLQRKSVPVVIGPGGQLYGIDKHHLMRSLVEGGYSSVYINVVQDWSSLSEKKFWEQMIAAGYTYLFDENGRGPRDPRGIPATVNELKDDPYRSLASAIRDAGAYQKVSRNFAEFDWASFLRSRVQLDGTEEGFRRAFDQAWLLAQTEEARELPGYAPITHARVCSWKKL